VPKPDDVATAVVVTGGKQYRVGTGDKILVDRVAAEPGTELTLDRVLLVAGEDLKIGTPTVDGVSVTARVIGHRRGPKIDVIRYKPKKRVRVHRGSRAELSAIEILSIGEPRPGASRKPARRQAASASESDAVASARSSTAESAAPRRRRPSRKPAAAEDAPDGA
jgi:large subunit ribosomal protein L21